MSRFKKYIALALIFALSLSLFQSNKTQASTVTPKVTDSTIYWQITSKAATSSIRYSTIGWTVHLYDEQGDPMKSGVDRVHFEGVNAYKQDYLDDGRVTSYYKIEKSRVDQGLTQNGMEGIEHNQTIHLSAIMDVVDENENKISGPYYRLNDIKNAQSWAKPGDLDAYWDISVQFDSADYPANVVLKSDEGQILNRTKKGDYKAGDAVSHTFQETMSMNGTDYEIARSYISPTMTGEKKYILESTDPKVLNRNAGVSVGGIDFVAEYKEVVDEPPDGTPKAAIYTPSFIVEPGADVGYEDHSFATDGETITYRELTITDQNGTEVGNYVNELSPSISFSTEGDYTFDLIVFSGNGKMDTDTKTITVQEDSAIVNPVLDISVPPMYETLYYSQEDFDNNKVTELRVFFNAEDSSSTNGIDRHYWYIEGDLVDATGDDPTYSQIIPFSPSDPSMSGAVQVVDSKTGDRAKAYDSLTINFDVMSPPVADIDAPETVLQGEEATITSLSYTTTRDNEIIRTDWEITPTSGMVGTLEGESSTVYFDTVQEYTITLTVEDQHGQTATDTEVIKVIPDNPTADFSLTGTQKQNRKLIFDASPSIGSVSGKFNVDHSLNRWGLIPLDGQSNDSIKVVSSSDLSTREVLFKEDGQYLARLKVTNTASNTSNWEEKIITINPDLPPIANIDTPGTVTRYPQNNNIATITLTDNSYSQDSDSIIQRIWKYKFDSNNDGSFDDENWTLIDDTNKEQIEFNTSKVGEYAFEIEVFEGFGQPTISQFLTSADIRSTKSNLTNVEVVNLSPVTSLESSIKTNIDLLIHVITDSQPVIDSYNANAQQMINNLKGQGIETNSMIKLDDEGVKATKLVDFNFTCCAESAYFNKNTGIGDFRDVWTYSSDELPSNYYGSKLEVLYKHFGQENVIKYPQFLVSKDKDVWVNVPLRFDGTDGHYQVFREKEAISEDFRYYTVLNENGRYVGTYSIEHILFIHGYISSGSPPIDDDILLNDLSESMWNNPSPDYAIIITDSLDSVEDRANVVNQYNLENKKTIFVGTNDNMNLGDALGSSTDGTFISYDGQTVPWGLIENQIKNDFSTMDSNYVLLEDIVNYDTTYSDYESDPVFDQRWKYIHDENYYENGQGLNPNHNQYITNPITQFNHKGLYNIYFEARDNPVSTDNRFDEYRLWSAMEPPYQLYVHERPIADFEPTLTKINSTTYELQVGNRAYDKDHFSKVGRGITEVEWKWKWTEDTTWTDGVAPSTIQSGQSIMIYQKVKDIEGAWSDPKISEIDTTAFQPPIAQFTVSPNPAAPNETLTYDDQSYDSNGLPIIERQWRYRVQGGTWSFPSSTPPGSFSNMNMYEIELKVKNDAGLWSDPYVQMLEVKNSPPVAGFTINPFPIFEGDTIQVTSTASDPDGNSLDFKYHLFDPQGNFVKEITNANFTYRIPEFKTGEWTIKQWVEDIPHGEPASNAYPLIKTFTVGELQVTGTVYHTDKWVEIHDKNNNNTDEFYSGEKFMLQANVTDQEIEYVRVYFEGKQIDGNTLTLSNNLSPVTNAVWTGSLYDQAMTEPATRLENGQVEFIFTVKYSNGTVKQDTIYVQIIGSVYEVLNYHRSN